MTGACGALPDATLTAAGKTQAVAAAEALKNTRPTRVYASTARRAAETGEIVAGALRLTAPPVLMAGLDEVGLGSREGALDPETRAETARVLHAWIVLGDLTARVADGETGHGVVDRMVSALETIAAAETYDTVVVVGHVASLTVGLSALCGIGPAVWGSPIPHAVPFSVEKRGRTWQCRWPVIPALGEPLKT